MMQGEFISLLVARPLHKEIVVMFCEGESGDFVQTGIYFWEEGKGESWASAHPFKSCMYWQRLGKFPRPIAGTSNHLVIENDANAPSSESQQ